MFITYAHRNGWKKTLLAVLNGLLLLALSLQFGGLMSMRGSRETFAEMSERTGYSPDGPLMGSTFADLLLSGIGFWTLAALLVALLVKEFIGWPLNRRLAINGSFVIAGFALAAYVINVLYVTPISSA